MCDVAHPDARIVAPEPYTGSPTGSRPLRPVERLTSVLEVIFCSGFPTQLLITPALVAVGVPIFDERGALSLRHVVWLSVLDTMVVTALVLFFLRLHGERATTVFLGGRKSTTEVLVGLALLPICFAVIAAAALTIEAVAPWLRNPDGNPLSQLLRRWPDILVFAAVAVVAGGWREELQRAFVLHRFRTHLGGAVVGLVVFSVAFGAGHLVQGADAAILTALLGALWGAVYLLRHSVVAPMVCHAAFNIIEVVYHGSQA